uniref:Glycosyltransferase n=1 Tax=Variovorax sp. HH01 TaxID=1084736 RepID=I3PCP0_9BURK|nr:hypothetical protein var070 [Variovorax sp. HH01]
MIDLFCGFDEREAAGFHTFCQSVIRRASKPVRITPLSAMGLHQGSNTFTLSRFLVPYLMGFKGRAIFMDACDMLMLDDVSELDALFDKRFAVQVVKHGDYQSQHARKYVGTDMECKQSNYSRKNWASVMSINCEHSAWFAMTPKMISLAEPIDLLQLRYFEDKEIGALPAEWNVLIDEGQEREGAKVLHWTAGLPTFHHYRNARGSADWFAEHEIMNRGMQ